MLNCTQLCHHRLLVSDPAASLAFYHRYFGMSLHATYESSDGRHYFLGFGLPQGETDAAIPGYPACLLELVYDPSIDFATGAVDGNPPGYWKIALAVADLEIARERLLEQGVSVTEPVMVPEVAYLCHCVDPNGYDVELIQHRFADNQDSPRPDPVLSIGTLLDR